MHPYAWSIYPSAEDIWANLVDFTCTALAGRPAVRAGGELANKPRKFGVLGAGFFRSPRVTPLLSGLAECGIDAVSAEASYLGNSSYQTNLRTAVESFKRAGVTSLICVCVDGWTPHYLSHVRSNTGWTDPEIITPLFIKPTDEENRVARDLDAAQRSRVFGIQPLPKITPVQGHWWWRAVQGSVPDLDVTANWVRAAYEQLLVIASGAQAAGPNLTPDTFGAALMALEFPNTDAGQAPEWQPKVGFGPGDHSFYDDYAVAWWNDSLQPLDWGGDNRTGSWCYLGGGTRYQVGQYPTDAMQRMYNPSEPCR